jgi:leucyl-tRNA synthetase
MRVVAADPARADEPFKGEAEAGDGVIVNSDFLNGMSVEDAKQAVITRAESEGWGEGRTVWRLRDWGVSRQRYWGTPIPFIHCDTCGVVPVPKDQLPVTLPEDVSFDIPGNPLERHPTWKHVDCPKCSKPALRETDTLDTFTNSSWYFLRFASQPA